MSPRSRSPLVGARTLAAVAALGLAAAPSAHAQPAAGERGAAALAPLVAGLGTTARVLMIGAHPDDEDNNLLAWLARGRHVRTAYLSLTRGDGGQNLIGNELGEALGVLRTEELLAARRVDGAEQFFSRAYDFGFSKSADETFAHWDREAVLGDVVRTVRAFRPHVLVSVFSGTPRDGHGHHQVAGLLAREVYDAAADTVRFPAGSFGPAWAPAKLYQGVYRFNVANPDSLATLKLNVGEFDALLGRSYAEVAAESRSQHRSQGFGTLQPKGVRWDWLERVAARVGPGDARAERSPLDGLDPSLARLQGLARGQGAPLGALVDSLPAAVAAVQRAYRPGDPSDAVAPLAALTNVAARAAALAGVPGGDPDLGRSLEDLWQRAQQALVLAAGVAVEATAGRETVAAATLADASDTLRVSVAVHNRGRVPVTLEGLLRSQHRVAPDADGMSRPFVRVGTPVLPDSTWRDSLPLVPTEPSAQWWRRGGRMGDAFVEVPDGRPEEEHATGVESGAVRVTARLLVAGARADVSVPVVQRTADPVRGEVQRPVAVVPGITLRLDRSVEYVPAGRAVERPLRVFVRSAYDRPRTVTVALALPNGLAADTVARTVQVPAAGQAELRFTLRGRLAEGRYQYGAEARVQGDTVRYLAGSGAITYDHVPPQRLYFPAATRVTAVPVTVPAALAVGYVPGVGDNVAPMLSQLGVPVTLLDPATLDRADLSRFSTIVVGPRAYEAQPALAAANPRLHDFARRGGTLVVQYGQYELTRPGMLPYPITLARPAQRVTLEEAPVATLAGASGSGPRILAAPNRIGAADWEGWVQERALYMPATADAAWARVLRMSDPGEPPNDHALLVAPLGRGTVVYTSLALFRQLPAGVPGAARLFVNLLAARPEPPRAASPRVPAVQ